MDASSSKSQVENLQSSIPNASNLQKDFFQIQSPMIPNDGTFDNQGMPKCNLCSSGGSEESQCHIVPGTELCRHPEQVGISKLHGENNNEDDVEDDEDDNHIIVAESPDGRWQRRNQTVRDKDIPGIDAAYLAIDTEEGVEVVWNEMDIFTDNDLHTVNEIDKFFANLIKLDHPNVVKFHNYWLENHEKHIRVYFITEHMSTGSLRVFLKKTKKTKQTLSHHSWKRWCIQLLSALDYLHGCIPPIIHGVLTTDAIFIQNNGLVKIGSISPDLFASRTHAVKDWSFSTGSFMAPELSMSLDRMNSISTALDIYMFGLVALEMQNAELNLKTFNGSPDEESILIAVSSLDPIDQDFLRSCLRSNPYDRPSAKQLLHHPAVFEIYSLRLLCAHKFIDHSKKYSKLSTNRSSNSTSKINGLAHLSIEDHEDRFIAGKVLATLTVNGNEVATSPCVKLTAKQDLCNFLEDVRNGHYPLTAYAVSPNLEDDISSKGDVPASKTYFGDYVTSTTSTTSGIRSVSFFKSNDQADPEYRRIVDIQTCKFEKIDQNKMQFDIQLNMLDVLKQEYMRRNLSTIVNCNESSKELTDELIRYGFISQEDDNLMIQSIETALQYLRQPLKAGISDYAALSINMQYINAGKSMGSSGQTVDNSNSTGDSTGSGNTCSSHISAKGTYIGIDASCNIETQVSPVTISSNQIAEYDRKTFIS